MQKIVKEYEVYGFDELSKGAQEKALEQLYDINVDHDWWLFDDCFYYFGNDIGIKVDMREINFSLDRDFYACFRERGIKIESPELFIKAIVKAGVVDKKHTKWLMQNFDYLFSLGTTYYSGGRGANYLDLNDEKNYLPIDTEDKLHAWFEQEFEQKLLASLRENYEGYTSREAVIDTINANEYKFLKNGKRFIDTMSVEN